MFRLLLAILYVLRKESLIRCYRDYDWECDPPMFLYHAWTPHGVITLVHELDNEPEFEIGLERNNKHIPIPYDMGVYILAKIH